MPITIIDGWEVSIRDCEFKNFISLVNGEKKKVPYKEQKTICNFLTTTKYTLTELMDYHDDDFRKLTSEWESACGTDVFISVLARCRKIIKNNMGGANVLRYLLYQMNSLLRQCRQF